MAPIDTRLYDVLGVSPSASTADIKRAYHKKSLECHPDKNPPERQEEASKEFQSIGHAFEVLSDEQSRAHYDSFGEDSGRGGPGAAGGMGGFGMGEEDTEDIFASMFGGGMGGMGGSGPRRPQRKPRRRAPPTTVEYNVTLEDLYNGRQARFNISRNIFCPSCQGSGARPGCKEHECADCKGNGSVRKLASMGNGMVSTRYVECSSCKGEGTRIREKERCKRCKGAKVTSRRAKLNVLIKPGMRDGQRLVFREQSDCVPGCEKPGHLIMVLRLKQSEATRQAGIEVKNNDILVEASITLSEALLGFQRAVFTHFDGRAIRIKSRPGKVVRPGDVAVVRGEGMPGLQSVRAGDLYIRWTIDFPPDDFLSQIDALKVAHLLPPKRSDPSRELDIVHGRVEEGRKEESGQDANAGDNDDEADARRESREAMGNSQGLGHVQEVDLRIGQATEFGSHVLPPLEDDGYVSEDDDAGAGASGSNCTVT